MGGRADAMGGGAGGRNQNTRYQQYVPVPGVGGDAADGCPC